MTCIVVLKDEVTKRTYMGGDSAGVDASHDLRNYIQPKVFHNGEFLMGYTTSFRMGQILEHSFTPPKIKRGTELYRYMVKDFIETVREALQQGGFARSTEEGEEEGGTFLVAVRDRVFSIQDDFQVAEYFEGFSAVGCGGSFALGALMRMEDELNGMSSEDRVRASLVIAERLSGGVRAPFTILSIPHRPPRKMRKRK